MGARSAGLLDYFNESAFKPNQAIAREEMASILAAVLVYEKAAYPGNGRPHQEICQI